MPSRITFATSRPPTFGPNWNLEGRAASGLGLPAVIEGAGWITSTPAEGQTQWASLASYVSLTMVPKDRVDSLYRLTHSARSSWSRA